MVYCSWGAPVDREWGNVSGKVYIEEGGRATATSGSDSLRVLCKGGRLLDCGAA